MLSLQASELYLAIIKKYRYLIIALVLGIGIAILQIPAISQKIQSYAITSTQELLGGSLLAPAQEQKIKEIALKMVVTRIVNIRKMNATALRQFGYHNAFAYFPQLLNIFPIGNQAFMYISEGFFEDLSEQEQTFLIGHELAHIKEQHTKYIPLTVLLMIILISWAVWGLRKKIRNLVVRMLPVTYAAAAFWVLAVCLWLAGILVVEIGMAVYQRHIERVADMAALEKLACHEGLLKITDRWLKEFKMPLHNDYYGIFADHPSCAERKAYCLELQQQHKGTSYEN